MSIHPMESGTKEQLIFSDELMKQRIFDVIDHLSPEALEYAHLKKIKEQRMGGWIVLLENLLRTDIPEIRQSIIENRERMLPIIKLLELRYKQLEDIKRNTWVSPPRELGTIEHLLAECKKI